MFSFAHAYAYLLFAESRPASPAAADPLDSLLTRLVTAPIEMLARRRRRAAITTAPAVTPCLRAVAGGRNAGRAPRASNDETLRPAA